MDAPHQWPNTVRVHLIKRSSGGLGIVVTPGPHGQGLDIDEWVKDGEAEKTGMLRPGDTILQVNDKVLSGLPYHQCLNILQELTPEELVTILVRAPEGYTTRLQTTFNELGTPHTIRVTELIDPKKVVRKGGSNPGSPRRSPALARTPASNGDVQVSPRRRQRKSKDSAQQDSLHLRSTEQTPKISSKVDFPDRPLCLTPSNQETKRGSISSPSRRPVRLHTVTTGHEVVESLVLSATEPIQCCPTACMGALMSGPPRRQTTTPRPKEEVLHHAKQFFDQYFSSIKRFNSPSHERRWREVVTDVQDTGIYSLKETELVYGAKLAWRNAPRCIGRIQWSKLQVFDARYVTTEKEMFDALCNHIKYATNKGTIRSAITIFPQRTDGLHDFRVWNPQLIMYAGYKEDDGTVLGDPANVDFTELCKKCGWSGARTRWDILPLLLSANGNDPKMFPIPEELVLRVQIEHPKQCLILGNKRCNPVSGKPRRFFNIAARTDTVTACLPTCHDWFGELNLQWYALPAVSGMLFDVGGIEFPAVPFNGWYMVTEIGSRDLCDPHRYNILEEVGHRLGLDTSAPSNLWKDRVVVEVNYAVLCSYRKANVTIIDHHTASESFMKHWENEMRLRGGCPADWVWIVPPLSGSLTPVFHQEMLYYNLKPSYEYQDPPWKHHIWERDREQHNGNGPRAVRTFREIARVVGISSKLFGMALSRRIKASVLFATETGRSEQYAKALGQTFSYAFNVNVVCMTDYDIINLEHETLLLIVTSTFGNGDPPENGEVFARNLQAIKVTGETTPDIEYVSNTSVPFMRINSTTFDSVDEETISSPTPTLDADIGPLSNVRFAVFALGSSAYPNFCSFGRYVDSLLGELGGERLIKMGTGDELCGQEHSFSLWAQEVFEVSCDVLCVNCDVKIPSFDTTWAPKKVRLVEAKREVDICAGVSRGTSRKVVPCTLKKRTILQSEEDSRATLLVEISTAENPIVKYHPGDHVGIYPANKTDLVDGILSRMSSTCPDPDQLFRLEIQKEVQSIEGLVLRWFAHDKIPPCTLRTAFTRYLDITTPPSQQFLRLLSTMTTNEPEKKKIELLATDSSFYEDWKSQFHPNLLELLEEFSSVVPTAEFLMTNLSSLQPRFYSISSAPEYSPGSIHLTVAVVVYKTQNGNQHYGVSSNYLATVPVGSEIACFVRSAPNFRLPDNSKDPVIMVGPGTGIAPFRSFWQQRFLEKQEVQKGLANQQFGRMTLLIGCRRPEVELYKNETQEMKKQGVLSELRTAYSRIPGQQKRYVQHILRDLSPLVYQQIVRERGHFYVCGDVTMAEDVNRTLRAVIQDEGNLNSTEVDGIIKSLQEENRYHEDIFGITLKTAEVTNRGREEARIRRSTSSN